jgi:hypothetical protein
MIRINFDNGRQNTALFQPQFRTAMDEAMIRSTALGSIIRNFSMEWLALTEVKFMKLNTCVQARFAFRWILVLNFAMPNDCHRTAKREIKFQIDTLAPSTTL